MGMTRPPKNEHRLLIPFLQQGVGIADRAETSMQAGEEMVYPGGSCSWGLSVSSFNPSWIVCLETIRASGRQSAQPPVSV
jgi:hypothetical protein